jgi:diguanylate cyclase (GGDEF)-like protein/putative nucleotidyltransferase with HDIG domain
MMNQLIPNNQQSANKAGFALFPAAILALAFAVYQILGFSTVQFAVLGVALLVSFILNQHQFTLWRIRKNFPATDFILFWSVIWLGAAGGILTAAGIAAGNLIFAKDKKYSSYFDGFSSVTSIFLAGSAFYLLLDYFARFDAAILAEREISYGWFVFAAVSMAAIYFVSRNVLSAIFLKNERVRSVSKYKIYNHLGSAVIYVCTLLLTFLFHFTFIEFGLSFGVVILFIVIGGHTAYKLFQARLQQKTREIVEASRIHLATVEALATAIDARDQVGVGHVRRTQIFAVGIGECLGLSEAEIQALRAGALLHDIGKLAVPDHILNKPGRLTPAEMEKMKIHSSVGASILEKVGFNYPVVPTVKYHHEMWDGGGYPEGLKGENIPLTARILTVADAYDALRGVRSYRDAVSREEARKFLINAAGKQFDPKIVDVFLRNLSRFEQQIEREGLAYSFDTKTDGFHITGDENPGYVQQIKRANREVYTLYELARVFSSSLNLQDTLSLFVEKIGEFVPFETCVIYLLGETGEEASAIYVEGKNKEVLKNKKIKVGQGATGFVLKKQQPVCQINPALDFSFDKINFVEEYTAMISLPLLANEKILGAVSLYSCELENYGEEHLRLLETVSRIASNAIGKTIYHAETETKALTDPMTGLPNARSLQMQFEKEVARANRASVSFQVLMLDLDGFKAVNDTFGHKAGDEMLRGIAGVMKQQLRDYDFLARYAGDEFAAIIPETEVNSVRDLCYRLEKAVCEFALPVGDGKTARVGVSIGAASYPHCGATLDQLIVAADKAMYSVKAKHKQRLAANGAALKNPIDTKAPDRIVPENLIEDNFIVELDESHVISTAIN